MRLGVRLTAFVVTVTAALALRSYWALVIGTVLQSVLNAAASYVFHPFRPRFSLAKRKELLGVSLWMFLASAGQTVHNQIEKIVVGRISSRNTVGLYSVSKDLSSIFTEEIGTALNRVSFVTTARTGRPLSADPQRLPAMLGAYGLIAAPLGFGLAATANEVLPLLLGSQWTSAAPLLAIIAPTCAFYAVYKLIIITLQAAGDARDAAFLSLAGAGTMVAVAVSLALNGHGASQVAVGALLTTVVLLGGGLMLLSRKAEAGLAGLLAAVARPFAAATLMMLAVQAIDTGAIGPLGSMAIKAPAGAAIFALAAFALWLAGGGPDGAEKTMIATIRQKSRQVFLNDPAS